MKSWRSGMPFVLLGALLLLAMLGCTVDGGFTESGRTGATMLGGDTGDLGQLLVYVGFNNYGGGSGGLSYYDSQDGLLKDTAIEEDIVDFVIHEAGFEKTIYFTSSSGTFYVQVSGSPSGWTATELLYNDGSFSGSDVLLDETNNKVYVLDPGPWPYNNNNTLYILETTTKEVSQVVDLGMPDEAFTRMALYDEELYYSDTDDGSIYKNGLAGENPILVTTTAAAAGPIYFVGDKGYVVCGAPYGGGGEPGVHVFDPTETPLPTTANHCAYSEELSAQYMAVKDTYTAYLTTWSSGVFVFDPAQAASNPGGVEFTLISGTDDTVSYQDAFYDSDNHDLYVAVYNGTGPDGLSHISNP